MSRAETLISTLAGSPSLAIACHPDPDTDCLASALALELIADRANVDTVDLLYEGDLSTQRRRTFVDVLGVDLVSVTERSLDRYELVAAVDHSPLVGDGGLPRPPDIVVDHRSPPRAELRGLQRGVGGEGANGGSVGDAVGGRESRDRVGGSSDGGSSNDGSSRHRSSDDDVDGGAGGSSAGDDGRGIAGGGDVGDSDTGSDVARFVDFRAEYGTTTSIFVEYLRHLDYEVPERIASALLFAVHRERLDFFREPSVHEYAAATFLRPQADASLVERLYGTVVTPPTLDAIGRALQSPEVRGSSLVSNAGRTTDPDALPQAVDYLLNLDGVATALVVGVVDGDAHLHARTVDNRVDLAAVLGSAFDDVGRTAGTDRVATAELPMGILGNDPEDDVVSIVASRVSNRFFDAMNLDGTSVDRRGL